MSKRNILGKIVQKDYNNELEKVIETKDFDEDVKNLLLGIFYKIDISYKDYKKVKRNVENKQEYIEKIIKVIENNCDIIKIAKPNSQESKELGDRTFLVDNINKKIICYPVERKLLYSISKIGKQNKILKSKHFVVNRTMSNMINIGNNINTVEPLRDFNGWSWLTIRTEIENIYYNLIYQNLRILVGEQFLNSWIENKEYVIDYYEEFKGELTERVGKKIAEKLILNLERISILLEIEINPSYEKTLNQLKEENEERLLKFVNNKEFIESLTEEKKQINKKIKKIEKILSSKESLEQEYTKINQELPLDKKVFSIKVIEKQMKAEKQELLESLEEKNKLLNPKKFIEEKAKLEKTHETLKVLEEKNKEQILEEIQKLFLQCFLVFINSAESKEEIIDLLYNLRYYNFLPFNEKININESKTLKKYLNKVKEELIKKATDYKIITALSQDEKENIKLLQIIFQTRIISLEDIYIAVKKEKDKYYIEISEDNENAYEEKLEIGTIKKDNLTIKLSKKIKILN